MATRAEASALEPVAARQEHGPQAVLEVAEQLFATSPEWLVFFREIMGLEGIVRRTFQQPEALLRFECSRNTPGSGKCSMCFASDNRISQPPGKASGW